MQDPVPSPVIPHLVFVIPDYDPGSSAFISRCEKGKELDPGSSPG